LGKHDAEREPFHQVELSTLVTPYFSKLRGEHTDCISNTATLGFHAKQRPCMNHNNLRDANEKRLRDAALFRRCWLDHQRNRRILSVEHAVVMELRRPPQH
jgi:hypothetical protein